MKSLICAFTLVLCSAAACSAVTLRFDFGDAGRAATENYNSVTQAQGTLFNTYDITGALTGIGLTTAGFNSNGDNNAGTTAPTGAAAIFATAGGLATRDSLFGHTSNFNIGSPREVATLTFTGLDGSGATSYDFSFFASRIDTGANPSNRSTQYSVAGANNGVASLDAANNIENVATVSGITPTAAGEIVIDVRKTPLVNNNVDGFFYLGALQVTSNGVVPEPATLGLISLAGVFALAIRRGR